jgi:hypothetical protein
MARTISEGRLMEKQPGVGGAKPLAYSRGEALIRQRSGEGRYV